MSKKDLKARLSTLRKELEQLDAAYREADNEERLYIRVVNGKRGADKIERPTVKADAYQKLGGRKKGLELQEQILALNSKIDEAQ